MRYPNHFIFKRRMQVLLAVSAAILFAIPALMTYYREKKDPFSNLPIQYPATEFDDTSEMLSLADRFNSSKGEQPLLVILLWTSFFKRPDWALGNELGQAPFLKLNCPVTNCYITRDRAFLGNASAVLVHFRDDFQYNDRPISRPPNQFWIYFIWESPEHTYHWHWQANMAMPPYLKANFGGFFNWTMTYRLDSDIPFLYGRFVKKPKPEPEAAKIDRLSTKTRNIIWIQSNCNTRSHRKEFVEKLQRYIDVEIMGLCWQELSQSHNKLWDSGTCKKMNAFSTTTDDCLRYINSTFRYYLATENSLCRDYVTEKFFRGASLDLIPVVFNGADMKKFGPPHSYIDAKDYKSPKELAKYLNELANNAEEYNSYFWWKEFYEAENLWDNDAYTRSFCDLCAKLTVASLDPAKYAKTYDDINDWWMEQGNCTEGRTTFY